MKALMAMPVAYALSLALCSDDPAQMCPSPSDPKVRYVADSDKDPSVCQTIRFTCADNGTPFSNECGCGCLLP